MRPKLELSFWEEVQAEAEAYHRRRETQFPSSSPAAPQANLALSAAPPQGLRDHPITASDPEFSPPVAVDSTEQLSSADPEEIATPADESFATNEISIMSVVVGRSTTGTFHAASCHIRDGKRGWREQATIPASSIYEARVAYVASILDQALEDGVSTLHLYVDNTIANCFDNDLAKWAANDWKKSSGDTIKAKSYWRMVWRRRPAFDRVVTHSLARMNPTLTAIRDDLIEFADKRAAAASSPQNRRRGMRR